MASKKAAHSNSDRGNAPPNENSGRDPMELALSQFTEEKRQGKSPSIEEFAQRFPDLASQIRELFPLVENLERWKSDKEVECLKRSVPKAFSFDRLGEYKLVDELGRGGMGVVFRAVHSTSQRQVAIKLLPWRYAADMPVWKERLQQEASTIAALKHPNIVPIYSFSEDQGYYYYVMQLIDGMGLDRIILNLKRQRGKKRPPVVDRSGLASSPHLLTNDSWRGFATVCEQVSMALAFAHKQGVAHNDIKPSNLLVRPNGQVIVTDFGIGRPAQSDATETEDHAVGTLRYMAPERWDGKLGPRGDIYSLGVTLYELCTQTSVFREQSRTQLTNDVLHREPTRPRQLVPEMPVPLEQIILKAMAKNPAHRYGSAYSLAADLRRFINRRPVHAAHRTMKQRTAEWWNQVARLWRKPSR